LQNGKRDRRRYRLRNETVDEKKYVVVRKIEKVVVVNGSWGLQKTELQGLQLGVVLLKNQAGTVRSAVAACTPGSSTLGRQRTTKHGNKSTLVKIYAARPRPRQLTHVELLPAGRKNSQQQQLSHSSLD